MSSSLIVNILLAITGTFYLISAVLAFAKARLENWLLKIKLRQALSDCLAFYELEEKYVLALTELKKFGMSPLAVKRVFRSAQRMRCHSSPSEEATPQRIKQELAKL